MLLPGVCLTEGGGARRGCCGGKQRQPNKKTVSFPVPIVIEPVGFGTYAEDKKASNDGSVFGGSKFLVGGTEEALLGATGNDALSGGHDVNGMWEVDE